MLLCCKVHFLFLLVLKNPGINVHIYGYCCFRIDGLTSCSTLIWSTKAQMIIDFATEAPLNRYHLMTQTIVPRPIAWVLSLNDADSQQPYNLAPFSYFNAISSEPPLLMLSVGKKPTGDDKDTRKNMLSGRDFVIHIASTAQAAALNTSAAPLHYGESEVTYAGIELEPFPGCGAPRIKACPVAFHCRYFDDHEVGNQAVIYAEILQFYIDDENIEQQGNHYHIDPAKLDPLARLGGSHYAGLGEVFSLARPK